MTNLHIRANNAGETDSREEKAVVYHLSGRARLHLALIFGIMQMALR